MIRRLTRKLAEICVSWSNCLTIDVQFDKLKLVVYQKLVCFWVWSLRLDSKALNHQGLLPQGPAELMN